MNFEWLKREKVHSHTEKWVERARNKSKPTGQKSGCEKQQQMGRDQRFTLRLESKFKSSNCWNDLVHSLMSKNTLAHSTITGKSILFNTRWFRIRLEFELCGNSEEIEQVQGLKEGISGELTEVIKQTPHFVNSLHNFTRPHRSPMANPAVARFFFVTSGVLRSIELINQYYYYSDRLNELW